MIQLKNENLLVKSVEVSDTKEGGLYLPKSSMEEEQVGDGIIEETFDEANYPKGARVFFHKIVPVDVRLDRDGDSKIYWFVNSKEILCVMTK